MQILQATSPEEAILLDILPQGEDTVAPKAEKSLHWTNWATFVLAIVVFVGGVLWMAHSEIGKIDDRLTVIDKHISRVETAVRIVGAKQGGDSKTLIDEALTVAKSASEKGHTENAKAILEMANQLVADQKRQHADAPQEFFDKTLATYEALKTVPALKEPVRRATLVLAEYRSEIAPNPQSLSRGSEFSFGEMRQMGPFLYLKDGYLKGNALSTSAGLNALDYTILDNVTFENAEITYNGGPVLLRNVRFINCRFHVPDAPQGEQFLAATIKQPANVQIGKVG